MAIFCWPDKPEQVSGDSMEPKLAGLKSQQPQTLEK